jgi:hypothetical protein
MSKNELRVIARIMLIGVGLNVFLQTFLTVLSSLAMAPFVTSAEIKVMPMIIVTLGIYALTALATIYFLARCANRCAAKIVEYESVDDTQILWLAVAFRLICVTAGVLFLYWSVTNIIATFGMYLSMYMNTKPGQQYLSMLSKADIIKYVVMLGFSIYLAYGAPGFVRWQVRRTLKQCGKIVEQQPTCG